MVIEWFHYLNVWYSDPHCILVQYSSQGLNTGRFYHRTALCHSNTGLGSRIQIPTVLIWFWIRFVVSLQVPVVSEYHTTDIQTFTLLTTFSVWYLNGGPFIYWTLCSSLWLICMFWVLILSNNLNSKPNCPLIKWQITWLS